MSATFRVIPTADVRPSAHNVRDDLGDLTELTASLRANNMQQPIIVTDRVTHYELVDGHRRHTAATAANIRAIPAIVTEVNGLRATVVTMLAAAMHKQLTPLEQAKAFLALMDDGMPVGAIAQATGYSRTTIHERVSLLELPAECQDMVATGALTLRDAVALAHEVKAKRAGSVATRASRSAWFTRAHPLAAEVAKTCHHGSDRRLVGSLGCGQCWEATIRDAAVAEYVGRQQVAS